MNRCTFVDTCPYAARKDGACRVHHSAQWHRKRAVAGWPTHSARETLTRTAALLVMLSQKAGASANEIRSELGVSTDRQVYRWLATLRRVEGLALETIDEAGEVVEPRSCRRPRYRLAAPPWKVRR